jgi:hypothetical protein
MQSISHTGERAYEIEREGVREVMCACTAEHTAYTNGQKATHTAAQNCTTHVTPFFFFYQDGGNAQHGKERTQHHKHLQKGLSERRGPRAMLHTRKACHTDRRASTSKEPNTPPQFPGATHF